MIPTRAQCFVLFDRFQLPSQKRIHVEAVTRLAKFLANKLKMKNEELKINMELLEAAALLHDIDKNIPKKEGERHPDTAVRILRALEMIEVAEVVRKHSVHCILNPELAPQTWEEKVLFLADKMTKYEVIGVDHRFKLWYKENLPQEAVKELDAAFSKVKALEKEVLEKAGVTYSDIQKDLVHSDS